MGNRDKTYRGIRDRYTGRGKGRFKRGQSFKNNKKNYSNNIQYKE